MTPADARSPSARDERLLAACAALVTVAVWASAFVGIRSAGRELAPGALALGRLLVGSITLGAFVLARRERLPNGRALAGTVLCGVLGFGLYNVALNAAERRVDAGIAAMLVNIGPILIAILAGLILEEGFPPRLLVGCIVSFAGVAVIGLAISRHGIGQTWGHAFRMLRRSHTRSIERAARRSPGRFISAWRRLRSDSRSGRTRSRAPPPGGWDRPPTSCRPSPC